MVAESDGPLSPGDRLRIRIRSVLPKRARRLFQTDLPAASGVQSALKQGCRRKMQMQRVLVTEDRGSPNTEPLRLQFLTIKTTLSTA